MCVLLLAYRVHPDYDLVVAANRDEFYERPTQAAQYWTDYPGVLAGRDLSAGGTWLGVNHLSNFAAVTNLRGSIGPTQYSPQYSRGHLVRDFLRGPITCGHYIDAITPVGRNYGGCNLLLEDSRSLHWWSNADTRELGAGVYGMSNTALGDDWPKVGRLKSAFAPLAKVGGEALESALFDILRDDNQPGSRTSPRPPPRLEETIFVRSDGYGTRCSTVVLRHRDGSSVFVERSFDQTGSAVGEARFAFARRLTDEAAVDH